MAVRLPIEVRVMDSQELADFKEQLEYRLNDARHALDLASAYLKPDTPEWVRLRVEEKKAQMRTLADFMMVQCS